MTKLITESQSPPAEIVADATRIAEKTSADIVHVEDAVDMNWFIRVEGNTDNITEREFEAIADTVESIIEGEYGSIRRFYSPDRKRYLIRLEGQNN